MCWENLELWYHIIFLNGITKNLSLYKHSNTTFPNTRVTGSFTTQRLFCINCWRIHLLSVHPAPMVISQWYITKICIAEANQFCFCSSATQPKEHIMTILLLFWMGLVSTPINQKLSCNLCIFWGKKCERNLVFLLLPSTTVEIVVPQVPVKMLSIWDALSLHGRCLIFTKIVILNHITLRGEQYTYHTVIVQRVSYWILYAG